MAKKQKTVVPVKAQLSLADQLDQWVFYGILAIVVALPLAMSRVTYDQFDIAKILALRVLTLGTMMLWVWKMITSREQKFRWSNLDFAVIGFLLLVFISTILSIHLPTALHGKFKRYEGFFTFANYGILYFLVLQTFTSFKRLSTLSTVLTFAGGLVSLYGVMQYIGLDPLPWATLPFEERRSFSTFGNPDLLGGFLVILLPIATAEFLRAKGKNNILMFTIVFITFMSLLWSFTRGAWVGSAIALLVFVIIAARELKTHWKKLAITFAAFVSVFGITAIVSAATGHNVMNLVERLKSITQITEGSAGSRLEIWKAGLEAIKARPFFGWGPDTFRLISERYETFSYTVMGQGQTVADNAHNYLIQLASGIGVPATVIFVLFTLVIVFFAIKYTWSIKGDEKLIYAGLISAVIGYFVHLLAGVSISGSTGVFWIIISALVATTPLMKIKEIDKDSLADISLKASMAFGTVFMVIAAYFAISMFAGDNSYAKAIRASNAGDTEVAFAAYDRAISLYNNGRYYDGYGMFLEQVGVSRGDGQLIRNAVNIYEAAKIYEPGEADHYVFLASARAKISAGKKDPMLETAIGDLRGALDVRPNAYGAHLLMGNILFYQGKYKEAIDYLNFAAKVKVDDASCNILLAKCYEGLGDRDKAKQYYSRVLTLQPDNSEAKQALDKLTKSGS